MGLIYSSTETKKATNLLAGAFGWMFAGLAVTAAVALVLAAVIGGLMANAADVTAQELILSHYSLVVLGSAILQFILMLVIQIGVLRRGVEGRNLLVPFLIYAANMGILFSYVALFTELAVLGMGLGLTVAIFGVMALYARFTKSNLSGLAIVGSGLLFGSLVLVVFNIFMGNQTIYWITTFAMFGAVMLITMFDVWKITRISETGANSRNLALYFALNLYVDFIYILLRVISFVGLARGRR